MADAKEQVKLNCAMCSGCMPEMRGLLFFKNVLCREWVLVGIPCFHPMEPRRHSRLSKRGGGLIGGGRSRNSGHRGRLFIQSKTRLERLYPKPCFKSPFVTCD